MELDFHCSPIWLKKKHLKDQDIYHIGPSDMIDKNIIPKSAVPTEINVTLDTKRKIIKKHLEMNLPHLFHSFFKDDRVHI